MPALACTDNRNAMLMQRMYLVTSSS